MAEHSAMAAADTRSLGTRDVRTVGIDLAFEVPSESDSLECTARAETETDAEMIVRVEIVSVAGDERRLLVTGTVTVQVDDGE